MKSIFVIAAQRMLSVGDVGLDEGAAPDVVREQCDSIARELVAEYLRGAIDWPQADAIANNIYELMISHCGAKVPDYAWDVFLAFDEGEIDDRGDSYTRPRIEEIVRKYAVA